MGDKQRNAGVPLEIADGVNNDSLRQNGLFWGGGGFVGPSYAKAPHPIYVGRESSVQLAKYEPLDPATRRCFRFETKIDKTLEAATAKVELRITLKKLGLNVDVEDKIQKL